MKRVCIIAAIALFSAGAAFGDEPLTYEDKPRTTFIDPDAMPAPAALSAVAPYTTVDPHYVVPTPRPVVTYRPVIDVAPMPPAVYTGRGLLGQPKLYVPGQPVRNFFRYLSP